MLIKNSDQLSNDAIALKACSFSFWYKKFEKSAIDSEFLEIPNHIVQYLLDEIIILPKECYPNESGNEEHIFSEVNDRIPASLPAALVSDDFEDDDDVEDSEAPEFPEFSKQISETIKKLGGSVFVKTNWHAPKDSYWITAGQTLKAKDITDVYQLLKASSIIKNDLSHFLTVSSGQTISGNDEEQSSSSTTPPSGAVLVMRKWFEIHPATEFRCFVRGRDLIAISPRDWPEYHEHVIKQRLDIVSDIVSFFKEKIKNQFPLEDFVFDAVRYSKDHVKLIDFSPFSERFTDNLAYDWDYLKSDEFSTTGPEDEDDPEFRYLSTDCGIQPTKRNNYGVPQDIIDMFSSGGSETINGNNNLTDLLASRVQSELHEHRTQ